jgi:hypothetical protein
MGCAYNLSNLVSKTSPTPSMPALADTAQVTQPLTQAPHFLAAPDSSRLLSRGFWQQSASELHIAASHTINTCFDRHPICLPDHADRLMVV